MELEGKIILELPEVGGVSKAGNTWRKKGWVLETFGNYPRKVKFDVFGDRIDTMPFTVGMDYVVSVDAESREFNEKWYTDLRAFASRPYQPGMETAGQPGINAGMPQSAPQQPYGQPQFAQAPSPGPVSPAMPGYTPDIAAGSDSDELPF